MFRHDKRLQYFTKPDRPDPVFANRLQEVIGGQWGEMSVSMAYLFQGWNCRGPAKYRDMLLDIGTEEIGHVEMLATMVARLLEGAPVDALENAAKVPMIGAILGGNDTRDVVAAAMNPQHLIVSGLGAMPVNSVGVPWNAGYIVASGNLAADFRFNVTAESQGRLQVARLYALTEDKGVRDFLSFLLARDTMHQNQWVAALAELERDGLDGPPVPMTFPQTHEKLEVSYQYMSFSNGTDSAQGGWASGPAPDGKGTFEYIADPQPMSGEAELGQVDPRLHGTPIAPVPPVAG